MTGYCVKCKQKDQEMKDVEVVRTKKGGYMGKGACTACGTTMCKMMNKEQAEEMQKAA